MERVLKHSHGLLRGTMLMVAWRDWKTTVEENESTLEKKCFPISLHLLQSHMVLAWDQTWASRGRVWLTNH